MFGLINKAVHDLIVREHGEDVWDSVRRSAGLPDEPFLAMTQYPDEVTYTLVATASSELGIAPEEILRVFGRHFMLFTAEIGYAELLPRPGDSIADFLKGLNALHTRIKLSLPRLEPPGIFVTAVGGDTLSVRYTSERSGLTPLAFGILEGLGERLGLKLTIEVEQLPRARGEEALFHLAWG